MFQTPAPRLIAHRGYTADAPENSLMAFQAAGKAGYWAIETDVHLTADGELVCNHDTTVDSMYDGSGYIRNMPLNSLCRLNFRKEFCPESRMPTFTEYLEICKQYHAVPFIESKCDAIPQILETAFRFFSEDEIILSSTSFEHLKKARTLSDQVFIHHIFSDMKTIEQLSALSNSGTSLNFPNPDDLPKGLITTVHSKEVRLCLRAGDTPEAVQRMMSLGLDYIPTNKMLPDDFPAD